MAAAAEVGIFTADTALVVTAWDEWMTAATGIGRHRAIGQPVIALIPDLESRGLLRYFHDALAGQVHVLAPAFHHYFIRCALSAPSAHFAEMQQRATIGPLRDDDQAIVGVIVAIEDVTARLEAERALAQSLAEGGGLRDDNWRVRQAAVRRLTAAGDRNIAISLVSTLRDAHRDFSFLSSALTLLASTNVSVTGPLVELLQDEDPDLRVQAALALGDQSDPAAIAPLLAALTDENSNVRFQAIESLGRLRATAAVDDLLTIVESRDFFLAFAALDALALMGDPGIAVRLVPLLDVAELRTPVADALAATGDITAVEPLVAALNQSPVATVSIAGALARIHDRWEQEFRDGARIADAVRSAIDQAGERHLVAAVSTAGADQLPGLVRVLGWLQSAEIDRTLTRLLGEPVVRNDVIEALARHGEGVVEALTQQLRSEDPEIRHAAIVALGRVGSKRGTPALVALLDEDKDLLVAVAGALARIADPQAFQPLLSLLRHDESSVRQAVIGALNSIGHPDMAKCVTALLDDDNPFVRESAVRIAGYFGYPDTADRLFACLEDANGNVRRAAIEHLPFLDDARVLPALLRALGREEAAERAAVARALARVDDPRAHEALARALTDDDRWVRYYAVRALAEHRHAPSLAALLDLAEHDSAPQVRIAAINTVGDIGAAEMVPRLERLTGDENDQISVAALDAIGRIADSQGLPALQTAVRADDPQRRAAAVAALGSHGSVEAVRSLEWAAAGDPDRAVARRAIGALARVAGSDAAGAEVAVDALLTLLSDSTKRAPAAEALATLPPIRIAAVARGLRHPHPEVRRGTIDALGRLQREEATRFIDEALADAAESVREAAVAALARLGARGMRDRVTRLAVDDPSKIVRRAATTALQQLQA